MQKVNFSDFGLIDFKTCWEIQESIFNDIISRKMQNRLENTEHVDTEHHLIFCEHNPVYTLGKSGSEKHLLINDTVLEKINATYFRINRGGDITFHGPGQLVGYPIFDLDLFFNDIHQYMRCLEEAVILTLADYHIKGERIQGLTGVWLDADNPVRARKICAFGVRCSRWVTMHGFALNVNTDLTYFNHIVPCGIPDKKVTSLKLETGKEINMSDIKLMMKHYISQVFLCEITEGTKNLTQPVAL